MGCLTTLDAYKVYAGITADSDNAKIRQILDAVESAIQRSVGRQLASEERTEYYNGNGRKILYLNQRPVTGVSGVWVDAEGYYGYPSGAFADEADAWTEGTDYVRMRSDESEENAAGLLAMNGTANLACGYWPEGDGNIKVTYTAGYSPIPEDLVLAVHLLASGIRSAADKGAFGPFKSETLGKYAYEMLTKEDATGADVVTARGILKSYREVVA